jgi:hypothetical protein
LSGLVTTISGFYTVDEIEAAKNKLFEVAKNLSSTKGVTGECIPADSLPRQQARKGENKRKADTEDLLKLYGILDRAMITLPHFVALKLSRIPPFAPDATDFCSLAASVEFLNARMDDVMKRFDSFKATANRMDYTNAEMRGMSTVIQSTLPTAVASETLVKGLSLPPPSSSMLSTAPPMSMPAAVPEASTSYAATVRSPPIPRPKRLLGTRPVSDTTIKSVPRRLTAFVGRLHSDTTADELSQFLSDAGLKDIKCRKLTAPSDRVFRTAAFQVSCSDCCRDLFYDESTWPAGVELRDWYFSSKSKIQPGNTITE